MRDAVYRMQLVCLDTLGIPYEVVGVYQIRYHPTPDLPIDEINAICEGRAKAAGLIEDRPRTAEEIMTAYEHRAKWAECLRSVGYNPGPLISLEEYLASGGNVDPLPDIGMMLNAFSSEAAWKQLEIDCPQ